MSHRALLDYREANRLTLPCLDCRRPLKLPDEPPEPLPIVRCECGIAYAVKLLATVHAEVWAYIVQTRYFCRRCDHHYHVPLVLEDDEGRIIPCPKHGPEPPRPTLATSPYPSLLS